MMITFSHKGNFRNTEKFLTKRNKLRIKGVLDRYGKQGVLALSAATPIDSGITADSWAYKVAISRGSVSISWTNSNVNDGVPIAVIIQYGHGTKNGGYVQGRDYINPAMRPIFDRISQQVWSEVIS